MLEDARSIDSMSDTRSSGEAAKPPALLRPSRASHASDASADLAALSSVLKRTVSQSFFYVEPCLASRSRCLSCLVPVLPLASLPTALECRCTLPTAVTPGMSPRSGVRSCQERQYIQHMTFQNLLSIRAAFSLCYCPSAWLMRAITFLSVDGVSPYET